MANLFINEVESFTIVDSPTGDFTVGSLFINVSESITITESISSGMVLVPQGDLMVDSFTEA